MSKGRTPPDKQVNHAERWREKLGKTAYEERVRETPDFDPWNVIPEEIRETWRRIGQAVFEAITTQRRGVMGHFEVGSGYSAQRSEPYVEIAVDLSPVQFSPAKARELGLMLLECAEAAESDALLAAFGREQIGLDQVQIAQLLDQFRKARERRRGGKVDAA